MTEAPSNAVDDKAPRERLASGVILAERYRIIEMVGAGGMGTVYAAEHLTLRKKVAVKVLHRDLLRLPNIAARFEREARATARIEHPNVTAALDFGALEDGSLFLVLEFVDGRTLREEIGKGPLPVGRALHIANQVASLLVAAQSLGIVHRDLKPENVLLVQRGDDPDFVKVMDFGIARMTRGEDDEDASQPLTKLGAVFGTPEYMAPEQALGQRVDSRADLYSLGVILFEMLSGVRPYVNVGPGSGILSQQITSPRPTFAERAPGIVVPPEIERVVNRLLAKGAQERYQKASDVVLALEALLAGHEPKKSPSSLPPVGAEPLPAFELTTKLPLEGTASEVRLGAGLGAGLGAPIESRPDTPGPLAGAAPPRAQLDVRQRLRQTAGQMMRLTVQARDVATLHADRVVAQFQDKLSPSAQQKLSGISQAARRWLFFSAVLLVAVLPVIVVAGVVKVVRRHDATVASAAPSVTVAPAPVASPAPQVVPLVLDETSKDPEVLLAIAKERMAANKEPDALAFVIKALGRQPERRNDERVSAILFRTADSLQRDIGDKTFSLLQGAMAGKGAEILYQIWLDRGVREATRKRAERWLRSEAFERTAPGAIIIATRLRQADSCEKKHALLGTAGKIGGPATLTYLEELKSANGCGMDGKQDCYPCLRKDARLEEAIEQVRARTTTKP